VDDDQARYSAAAVDRLVEGWGWHPGARAWIEYDGSWAVLRSVAESSGDVHLDSFAEVMDIERAVDALRVRHPQVALLVLAVMHQWGTDDLKLAFGTSYEDTIERAKRWLWLWLAGRDPEQAFRGRRHRRWA
jgi:hypothetical protein